MASQKVLCLALLALLGMHAHAQSAMTAEMSPIRKVVTLVEEMKVQVEKEAKDDEKSYDAYKCWCETNEREKTAAVATAEARIEELEAFVEEAAGKEGQLKTEIAGLEEDIAADKESLSTATAVREKENGEFAAEEADMKETIGLLGEALSVLSKVQLLQKGGSADQQAAAKAALLQVKSVIEKHYPKFRNTMQRDLYDLLGSLQETTQRSLRKTGSFLGEAGWVDRDKSDEQKGMEANPNSEVGAGAGAKSYNSRSGKIVGLLAEMKDEFVKDLGMAQKEEMEALISFQHLRAAKLAEIGAATNQKNSKEAELADTMDKAAKAKEDIEALKEAMTADQAFLMNLTKNCKVVDEEYAARVKVRNEEIRALAETLKILTGDEARDLFGKTISLLQVNAVTSASQRAAVQDKAKLRAMQHIAAAARRNKDWALASLAVRVRLDAFTKVKEAMDKMLAELNAQQKEEYEKWEFCKKSIDETEDNIKVATINKNDLGEKHLDLSNTLETLTNDIAQLKAEVADMEVSLKQAGEQRREENELYQTSVADQRAAINILNMALKRLKTFYEKSSLAQIQKHSQEPGAAAPPPPPKPAGYEKSASSGGVIQMIAKIIREAESEEAEMQVDEQHAQESYATYVKDTTTSIEANRAAIAEKEKQAAEAKAGIAETEEAQLSNGVELEKFGELLRAHHTDCDFILDYFDLRQQSRKEEMDSIEEAKAILSGADFGL